MAKVMLVQPWLFHDEGIQDHDLSKEWRNGPYSLLLLATQLKNHNHEILIVDMARELVKKGGKVEACLGVLSKSVSAFKPDIIGFSFFSIHYLEIQKAVEVARNTCLKLKINPIFIAGGVHASIEPLRTIQDLKADYSFVGEADLGIVQLANGQAPLNVQGVVGRNTNSCTKGEEIRPLDRLPFPDWSLCDYNFYSYPTWARLRVEKSGSLDMMMGRGCVNRCSFCAYSRLSPVRYYTAGYLIEQMRYMRKDFGVNGIYFSDSSLGNNWKLLREFCELMIQNGFSKSMKWYGNMRADQVDEEKLKLLSKAGCNYLFYGFESGSQRMLDLMNKKTTAEDNYRAANLHNKLRFPYNASMIIGYPGEREEDLMLTHEFLRKVKPPSVGLNWYVPLPGSSDYEKLKVKGEINPDDPEEWRRIGEVNPGRIYANVPERRFRALVQDVEHSVQKEILGPAMAEWGFKNTGPWLRNLKSVGFLQKARSRLDRGGKSMSINNMLKRIRSKTFLRNSNSISGHTDAVQWQHPFEVLRKKWSVVPAAFDRVSTNELLLLPDEELLTAWKKIREDAKTGENFAVRGWYHLIYRDVLRKKKVLDVGSGLGIDGITFAQHGAQVTFVDIVQSNVQLLKRICGLLGVSGSKFLFMEEISSLSQLPSDYDVIWCQGSLINAPVEVTREEVQELLKHLPVGGRWVELAYPKSRWERDGRMPFELWGEKTDGGAPWMEWYDLEKLQSILKPAVFDVVLNIEFYNGNFNWFDLVRLK